MNHKDFKNGGSGSDHKYGDSKRTRKQEIKYPGSKPKTVPPQKSP